MPFRACTMKETTRTRMPGRPRILIFTGDGKGKTTAAMGMALRAAGHDMPTRIIQFLKSDTRTGECAAFKAFPHVQIQQVGKGFVPNPGHPAYACHKSAALHGLELAGKAIRSSDYALVVLDEICTAMALGLVQEKQVTELIRHAPANLVIALTGRGATRQLIEHADTVTEMTCIKHGMQAGHHAQKGCEF